MIALVERSISLFEQLGGLDQRDQLLFKDIVRSNVLTASSGLLLVAPTDEELTLGDAWLEVFQQALPRNQFGEEPPCRQQFVDGAPRQVKSDRRSWLIDTPTTSSRQRVWVTTAEACTALGMSRETLRQLRLRGVLTPGKHYRRWGCTQGRGPLQWHLENVEATITGWSRRHLQH